MLRLLLTVIHCDSRVHSNIDRSVFFTRVVVVSFFLFLFLFPSLSPSLSLSLSLSPSFPVFLFF